MAAGKENLKVNELLEAMDDAGLQGAIAGAITFQAAGCFCRCHDYIGRRALL